MKKFGIVLLALGLIAAFSMSASAADVKFSGEYYAIGNYISNSSLLDSDQGTSRGPLGWYNSRLRVFTEYKVADGLTLTTRFDAMEQIWGSTATTGVDQFAFERAYATFKTGIGTFSVGAQGYNNSKFGTTFLDSTGTYQGLKYRNDFGPVKFTADWFRISQGVIDGTVAFTAKDTNADVYELAGEMKSGAVAGGINVQFWDDASKRAEATAAASRYTRQLYVFDPYVTAKFGNLSLEAEGYWVTGSWKKFENSAARDNVDVDAQGLYVNAKYTMGPAYFGALAIYMSGDDDGTATATKVKTGAMNYLKLAKDNALWGSFTSILWNGFSNGYHDVANSIGNAQVGTTKYMDNVQLWQVFGGYQITKKLGVDGRLSTAKADKLTRAQAGADKSYGTELDLSASYALYDNLSYNVGAAYLWTGDYFKGDNANGFKNTANNYYLSHWIDLNF
jgi:hypothetical protein